MNEATTTWPDLAIGLYDRLTGRNAAIEYAFDELTVDVPSTTGDSERARWTVSGRVRITTNDDR